MCWCYGVSARGKQRKIGARERGLKPGKVLEVLKGGKEEEKEVKKNSTNALSVRMYSKNPTRRKTRSRSTNPSHHDL